MAPSFPHLVIRERIFYFRRAVPENLVALLGRSEVKVSLQTTSLAAGKVRARRLSSALDLAFENLKGLQMITHAEIIERTRTHFKGLLSKALEAALLYPLDPDWDREAEIKYLEQRQHDLRARLVTQDFGEIVRSEAVTLLNSELPEAKLKNTEGFQIACHMLSRALIEHDRILSAKFAGHYEKTLPLDPVFSGMYATELPPLPGEAIAKSVRSCRHSLRAEKQN